ncbi:diguanylate cyclase [Hoeflea sp. EC-HK425]|uniref:GGDEF domain-containing protein n=1 Tax=Hoeflea sp. EC-HK425 TaxID=2038388 RepID=UPI0012570B48|nr:diguanylate cyclase [Hoeflea sp. EC-HK425]VVT07848.1 Diguanylate cyclase (GGDEF) domain-containing protein [Hoeflea sp. EC-HK425]
MRRPTDNPTDGSIQRPVLDRLLRFDRSTEARYEAEHGRWRAAHLRHTIIFGVLLYVLHDISTYLLLPDHYWIIVLATLFVIVPCSLAVAHMMARVSAGPRELLATGAILTATALPIFMMYYSDAPHSTHMNTEVILCIVFANMVMALRFRHALVYSSLVLLWAASAVLMKQGVALELKIALCFQFTSVCLLTTYSNYVVERRRCRDYRTSLEAMMRAEMAETSEKQFQEMSKTDALTGLPNRRFLDERLGEWFTGDGSAAAVMMIDIDHFKLFNDTLGHPAGDECLKLIADAFRSAFSEPDAFCARFGGEEFILAIRETEEVHARHLANAVVRAIEALGIPHPGRSDGVEVVTVSVGVALNPLSGPVSQHEMLSQADEALYQAKRAGRNRFVMRNDVVDPRIAVSP